MISGKHVSRILVLNALSLLVGCVLTISGTYHIDNNYQFLSAIHNYRLLPHPAEVAVAVLFPSLELVIGLGLVFFPSLRSVCFTLSVGLFSIFTLALISAVLRGLDIDCGCFAGPSDHAVGLRSISRAGVLLVVSVIGVTISYKTEPRRGD